MMDLNRGRVLIVDDKLTARKILLMILSEGGFEVFESTNAEEALKRLPEIDPEVIITETKMTGMPGTDLCQRLYQNNSVIPVIFLTAFGNIESAVNAMSMGAYHYLLKPCNFDRLKQITAEAVKKYRTKKNITNSPSIFKKNTNMLSIITNSPNMIKIYKLANDMKDSTCNVLITGETGTGKEVIARYLHYSSQRKNKPFVTLNCAAIPKELMEAELFGNEKGAFTGATTQRIGKFEAANGGTLLLDEITELDLPLQAKLLRVLQEKEIIRLGSNDVIKVDFRLVCSTNRSNLEKEVELGNFREDLFYRIDVLRLNLPPLRERIEDIPLLASAFLEEFCKREKKILRISNEVKEAMCRYSWPGNIRQLRNVIERAVILAKGSFIAMDNMPEKIRFLKKSNYFIDREAYSLKNFEKDAICKCLKIFNGNKTKVAEHLGISRKCLYKRIKEYQIH
jgi:DNA-binding NtrC family response regulator